MKVAFYTLGCKLNQAETESLTSQFSQSGFQITSSNDLADIYIANTCTVTHIADRKSRHWLRLARRRNPQAVIIATGCYAQRSRQELAELADLVVDNKGKEHLLALTEGLLLERTAAGPVPNSSEDHGRAGQAQMAVARTRSLIKIQDGCHSPCTYCIVPRVRPREYSLPAARIIDEVKQKVASGYREVVLTGTKVGSYKDAAIDLKDLAQRILGNTRIQRLRLSSLQPQEISPSLLSLWQDERLCRHFHLALQSGSDTVLDRMKRSYSLDQYQKTIDLIRETIPAVAITTDIMLGFPGESAEEFQQSYSFCQQAAFANIHVFPFSPRPATIAARMPQQIEDQVKKERGHRMLELSRSSRRRFCERFIGQTATVLWEKETSPGSGVYSGLTGNYIRVFSRTEKPLTNEITAVKLTRLDDQTVWGEIVNENPG